MKISPDEQIKQHSQDFDWAEPLPGHVNRFEQRLFRQKIRRHRWISISSVAASLALLLIVQMTYRPHTPDPDSVYEVVRYYNMQLNSQIDLLRNKANLMDNTGKVELLNDLEQMHKEYLNTAYQPPNILQEEQIAYIIQNYNAQIESLRHIEGILEAIVQNQTKI